MSTFIALPSALIQASGFQGLTLGELRLFWRIIGLVTRSCDLADALDDRLTLRVETDELMEAGDKSRSALLARLETLSGITFKANLDGRDGHELWRMSLRLVSEYELRDEFVEIDIGRRMFRAIQERTTFARVTEAVLFSMRGSKYSAILYTLIRDKMNQRENRWEMKVDYFRQVMQVSETAYDRFSNLRSRVIEPAIAEVNELSEFTVTWSKARTWKNTVREIALEWELKKAPKPAGLNRSKPAGGKVAPLTDRALNYLKSADFAERTAWAQRARDLGCPPIPAMEAFEHVGSWASWVARPMAEAGLIKGE